MNRPWAEGREPTNSDIRSERLDLLPMSLELMETLQRGDTESARRLVDYHIPADWPESMESVLRYRIAIAREQPETLPLLLRVMVLRTDSEVAVGRIGFHGPPDESGMLEIGYEVFEPHRRHGYAKEAVLGMFRWAQRDPAVHRFRATISPDNEPSRNLITGLGFIEVGTQWDEEDGEETIFERAADQISLPLVQHRIGKSGREPRPDSLGC